MDTPTPRTESEIQRIKTILDNACTEGGWNAPVLAINVDFARTLERELIAANAQIAALRSALDSLQDLVCGGGYTDVEFAAEMDKTNAALSAPPPPVVPLEDVRPLIAAIMDATRLTMCPTNAEANLINATKAFIAKYPTP